MIFKILLVSICIGNFIFSEDLQVFKLKNGTNFSSYTSEGSWEDNLGNYGLSKCMGTVTTMPNSDINLNIIY